MIKFNRSNKGQTGYPVPEFYSAPNIWEAFDTTTILSGDQNLAEILRGARSLPNMVIKLIYSPKGRYLAHFYPDGKHHRILHREMVNYVFGNDLPKEKLYGVNFQFSPSSGVGFFRSVTHDDRLLAPTLEDKGLQEFLSLNGFEYTPPQSTDSYLFFKIPED